MTLTVQATSFKLGQVSLGPLTDDDVLSLLNEPSADDDRDHAAVASSQPSGMP